MLAESCVTPHEYRSIRISNRFRTTIEYDILHVSFSYVADSSSRPEHIPLPKTGFEVSFPTISSTLALLILPTDFTEPRSRDLYNSIACAISFPCPSHFTANIADLDIHQRQSQHMHPVNVTVPHSSFRRTKAPLVHFRLALVLK